MTDLTDLPAHESIGPEAERERRRLAVQWDLNFRLAMVRANTWEPRHGPPSR